jgi:hypothetical protein
VPGDKNITSKKLSCSIQGHDQGQTAYIQIFHSQQTTIHFYYCMYEQICIAEGFTTDMLTKEVLEILQESSNEPCELPDNSIQKQT